MYPPDLEAELTFLTTDEGGRRGPAFSGYRPQFHYAGRDWDTQHEYPDVERAYPGQTVRVLLRFLSPNEHVGRIYPGMDFEVREGRRVVAHGRISRILDLANNAERARLRTKVI